IVEDVAIIRLVDHRRALHGFRRKTNLVPNHPGASLDLAVRNLGRDRVGILDRDGGKRDVQLGRLFAIFLRHDQNVGGFFSVGFGQHGSSPRLSDPVTVHAIKSKGTADRTSRRRAATHSGPTSPTFYRPFALSPARSSCWRIAARAPAADALAVHTKQEAQAPAAASQRRET